MLRFFCRQAPWNSGIDLAVAAYNGDQLVAIAEPLVLTSAEPGRVYAADQGLHLSPEAAQELMDGLWQCGVRPTDGAGSAGAMAAAKAHIDDLRRIAFTLLSKARNAP